jgi:preprotein translocase subunit SecG
MSRFKGYYDVLALFVLLFVWVVLVLLAYFSPHLCRNGWSLPLRLGSCVFWLLLMLVILTRKREGGNAWSKVYRGENAAFGSSGSRAVMKGVGFLIAFSFLVGIFGADVAVYSGDWFATSISSDSFRVTDVSFFRKRNGTYFSISVEGRNYSGSFPWSKADPVLIGAEDANGTYRGGIDCLSIKYRYGYLGATVLSINRCGTY